MFILAKFLAVKLKKAGFLHSHDTYGPFFFGFFPKKNFQMKQFPAHSLFGLRESSVRL